MLENEWALSQRRAAMEMNEDVTPKPTREAILKMCQLMWETISHADLAEKAYRQTGPGLPLEGPVVFEDIGKELRKAREEIDPGQIAGELGTKIRDDATAFVNDGWGTKWTSWYDAYDLL